MYYGAEFPFFLREGGLIPCVVFQSLTGLLASRLLSFRAFGQGDVRSIGFPLLVVELVVVAFRFYFRSRPERVGVKNLPLAGLFIMISHLMYLLV